MAGKQAPHSSEGHLRGALLFAHAGVDHQHRAGQMPADRGSVESPVQVGDTSLDPKGRGLGPFAAGAFARVMILVGRRPAS
jgi:hypothetical protein